MKPTGGGWRPPPGLPRLKKTLVRPTLLRQGVAPRRRKRESAGIRARTRMLVRGQIRGVVVFFFVVFSALFDPCGVDGHCGGAVRGRLAQKACPCPRLLNLNPFGVPRSKAQSSVTV
jgi:hypothetical protein